MSAPAIEISTSSQLLTRLAVSHTGLSKMLGNMESALLSPEFSGQTIRSPIYISGLARSGSTMLLEILANHPATASHVYGDFPFLFTPCWWNAVQRLHRAKPAQQQERAHGDGIFIDRRSPEAMEEILWVAFFESLHTTQQSNVLDEHISCPPFEKFYRDHIKKILHIRKGQRYLAKANYNITRLPYLHTLFPDARFIIPIRHPVAQVESLMRQHHRFMGAAVKNSRVADQLKASGHFEFGPQRIPIHTGDNIRMQEVLQAWESGQDAKGYALQWAMIYRHAHDILQHHPVIKEATLVVPFEQLCGDTPAMLGKIHAHCSLSINEAKRAQQAGAIRSSKNESALTPEEVTLILDICGETAALYGYA